MKKNCNVIILRKQKELITNVIKKKKVSAVNISVNFS